MPRLVPVYRGTQIIVEEERIFDCGAWSPLSPEMDSRYDQDTDVQLGLGIYDKDKLSYQYSKFQTFQESSDVNL